MVAGEALKLQAHHRAPAIEHHQLGTHYGWNPDEDAAKKKHGPDNDANDYSIYISSHGKENDVRATNSKFILS